jgi:hypothetical protein
VSPPEHSPTPRTVRLESEAYLTLIRSHGRLAVATVTPEHRGIVQEMPHPAGDHLVPAQDPAVFVVDDHVVSPRQKLARVP